MFLKPSIIYIVIWGSSCWETGYGGRSPPPPRLPESVGITLNNGFGEDYAFNTNFQVKSDFLSIVKLQT